VPETPLEPNRAALIVIDLQRGIVGSPTAPHSAQDVVGRSGRLLARARGAGMLPVLVHVGGSPDQADRLRPSADRPAPAGQIAADWSDFVPEMSPQAGDIVVFKRQWGAFYGTDLDLQLRRRRIDTLILCGISTEFGVESTARDAYERDFRLFLVEDAMTGRSEESHRNSVERIFPRIGHVRRTTEILELITSSTKP
jgi:nicotinamidase-related amidase